VEEFFADYKGREEVAEEKTQDPHDKIINPQ
jgi:hypothetical protein